MTRFFTLLCAAALGMAAFSVAPAQGQRVQQGAPILVLNQDSLLTQSLFGQRIQSELDDALRALAAENRVIEAQLMEEELELTELRPTMAPAEFREIADEFDTRVVAIRAAQDAKTRDLQVQSEEAQQRFFEESFPVLLEIIEARGASVLLDSRTVLLSADSIDITDAAIAAVNAAMGRGGDAPLIAISGLTPLPQ